VKQIAVFIFGSAGDDAAARQQYVGLDQRIMNETVLETGRFDADANRRAANRNVLELRRNQRQKTVCEAMRDDRFERRQSFDFERLRPGIELDDFIELAERNTPLGAPARLITKQIRDRRLG
jgi:hypothetical protein